MFLQVTFEEDNMDINADFGEVQEVIVKPESYQGNYEVTPSRKEHVLHTSDKLMEHDVVVHAIPKEYGLITYNQDRTITIT